MTPGRFVPSAWESTPNLVLDDEGRLFLAHRCGEGGDDRFEPLGPIGWADVPEALAGELAGLLDAWRDAPSRADLHREWDAGYRAGLV